MEHIELIFEFFLLFSKFEYALKMSGFHKGNGNAEPNWEKFAEAIKDKFDKEDKKVNEGIEYILKNPPNKQIVKDDLLEWSDTTPNFKSEVELILLYVRRVRNNLFHGGKYKGHRLENPDRSKKLLSGCIEILKYCLTLSPEANEAFEFNYTDQ